MRRRSFGVLVLAFAMFVGSTPAARADFPTGDRGYHNFQELVAEIKAVAASRPGRVKLGTIGESYAGRKLWYARISNDRTDNLNEPGVLLTGGTHAREHMSVEVVLGLFKMFAAPPNTRVRELVETRQIYVVFNLNPDGSEFDIQTGHYRDWRKNTQPTPYPPYVGTDLNRNYSYKWGAPGSTADPSTIEYRGPRAFSAPETRAIRNFVEAHPNITVANAYHSYGGEVLFPYGYTPTDYPGNISQVERRALIRLAQDMAAMSRFVPRQSGDKYRTPGDFIDWAFGEHNIFAFTIELSGSTFYPPDDFIAGEINRSRSAAIRLASVARCPVALGGGRCS